MPPAFLVFTILRGRARIALQTGDHRFKDIAKRGKRVALAGEERRKGQTEIDKKFSDFREKRARERERCFLRFVPLESCERQNHAEAAR
jgi:hypothetical protein